MFLFFFSLSTPEFLHRSYVIKAKKRKRKTIYSFSVDGQVIVTITHTHTPNVLIGGRLFCLEGDFVTDDDYHSSFKDLSIEFHFDKKRGGG